MQAATFEDPNAVFRPVNGEIKRLRCLPGGGLLDTGLQEIDALPDVLQHVDDPQEGRDGDNLGSVEPDVHAIRIDAGQEAA
jgi:hypothetical protein